MQILASLSARFSILFTLLLFFTLSHTAFADPGFAIKWQKSYAGTAGYDVQPTSDDGYIAIGVRDFDLFVVKTDAAGTEEWNRTISINELNEGGYSVEETNDGGYILIGSFLVGADYRPWLVKLDANGNTLWSTENGLSQTTIVDSALIRGIERSDGSFVVVGGRNTMSSPQDPWVLTVDPNGNATGLTVYPNPVLGFGAGTYINKIIPTPDGGFAFMGYVGPTLQAFLWKFDASAQEEWIQLYLDDGFRTVQGGTALADGSFILTGCDRPNCNTAMVVKTDAAGDVAWKRTYPTTEGYTTGTDIIPIATGYLYTEVLVEAAGDPNYVSRLIELDSEGNAISTTPIEGGEDATYLNLMRHHSNGSESSFIVVGTIRNPSGSEFFLLKGDLTASNPPTAVTVAAFDAAPQSTPVALLLITGLVVLVGVVIRFRR